MTLLIINLRSVEHYFIQDFTRAQQASSCDASLGTGFVFDAGGLRGGEPGCRWFNGGGLGVGCVRLGSSGIGGSGLDGSGFDGGGLGGGYPNESGMGSAGWPTVVAGWVVADWLMAHRLGDGIGGLFAG